MGNHSYRSLDDVIWLDRLSARYFGEYKLDDLIDDIFASRLRKNRNDLFRLILNVNLFFLSIYCRCSAICVSNASSVGNNKSQSVASSAYNPSIIFFCFLLFFRSIRSKLWPAMNTH